MSFISKCMKITIVISTGRNSVECFIQTAHGAGSWGSVDLIIHVFFIFDIIKENHAFY